MSIGGVECPYLLTLVVSLLEFQTPPAETAEQQPYAWSNWQQVGADSTGGSIKNKWPVLVTDWPLAFLRRHRRLFCLAISAMCPLLPFAQSPRERQLTKYSGRFKRLLNGKSSAIAAGQPSLRDGQQSAG